MLTSLQCPAQQRHPGEETSSGCVTCSPFLGMKRCGVLNNGWNSICGLGNRWAPCAGAHQPKMHLLRLPVKGYLCELREPCYLHESYLFEGHLCEGHREPSPLRPKGGPTVGGQHGEDESMCSLL
eukprot:1157486-Pelagomonas_calceolata.AAC.12